MSWRRRTTPPPIAAEVEAARNGASVRELAAFTGLSTNTISRWKRGE